MDVAFANPYLKCDECGEPCIAVKDNKNVPCGHQAGATSSCPSWGPVDGCKCKRKCHV